MKFRSDPSDHFLKALRGIVDDAQDVLRKAGHSGGSRISSARDRIGGSMDRVRGASRDAGDKVKSGAYTADDTIRGHPYETIALALGVGLVLGYFISRK